MSLIFELKNLKWLELIKSIIYAIIYSILGGLSYWYYLVIKDIIKYDFDIFTENEVSDIIFNHYNTFVVG
jgi:hypothetical protein